MTDNPELRLHPACYWPVCVKPTEQRWIPVSERLPDEDVPVWIFTPRMGLKVHLATLVNDEEFLSWPDPEWSFDVAGKEQPNAPNFGEYSATHWMPAPIPDPPEV